MRHDIAKVIVERPRAGGAGHTFRERRNELKAQLNACILSDNYDDISSRESIRYWASTGLGYDRKELNENLNPLRRFFRSRVGKVWEDVYSEMCEVMDTRSACQMHIWQHAKDYVETRTYTAENGEVYYVVDAVFSWKEEDAHRPIKESFAEVYVDPATRELRLVPKEEESRKRRKRAQHEFVTLDKWHQCHRIGEHWFMIELKPIPKPYWKPWTEKQREENSAKLAAARITSRWFYYNNGKTDHDFAKSAVGRWIKPGFTDVAYGSIMATWRGEYEKYGKNHFGYDFDSSNAAYIYGRSGIYAHRRWQMCHNDIRRWVHRVFPPVKDEPEVI